MPDPLFQTVATSPAQGTAVHEYFSVAVTVRNRWGQGDVVLGIPLPEIEAVERFPLPQICPLPGLPPAVQGVRQRRGSLIWVVDLGAWLGLPGIKSQPSQQQPALILKTGTTRVTCLVNHLNGIVSQGSRKLHPVPPLQRQHQPFIQGILPDPRTPLAIVNMDALWLTLKGSDSARRMG